MFFSFVTLLLGLASCGSRPNASVSSPAVPVIDVEAAMADLQPALKLSDFGVDVRYIPLETRDSCLVSLGSVKVFDGNIVVSSRQNYVVLNFDKETGRFIAQLGHRGGRIRKVIGGLHPIIMKATVCSILRDCLISYRNMMRKGSTGGRR